jgi:hypothetical protein
MTQKPEAGKNSAAERERSCCSQLPCGTMKSIGSSSIIIIIIIIINRH